MTKYKITYVINSDYCQLNPSDKECLRDVIREGKSKTDAIMRLHQDFGMQKEQVLTKGDSRNIVPVVWEIN